MKYENMSKDELNNELKLQQSRYDDFLKQGLSYDMTRGKPCTDQLELSTSLLDSAYIGNGKTDGGVDCRNYGVFGGIDEARALMGELLGVDKSQVIVGGNSSLNMMYDIISAYMLYGTSKGSTPWCKQGTLKFICPVPGYDRHFGVTEALGFELITVPINPDGPDMDAVEALVRDDASVKGIWSVPKYSNPTGYVYSDETIRRLASMKCAADDFRIMWDDAYTVHFLEDAPAKQLNLIKACHESGNPDRAIMITSTSKITFPGAGVAAIASSEANIKHFTEIFSKQTIGPDKLNQLRHVHFLKNYDGVIEHMKKHAQILKPKFDAVIDVFRREADDCDIMSWTEPKGGYFISLDTKYGCASAAVAMAKKCGVAFTPAGATYPYGKDPSDSNIRIAPSFPPLAQIPTAVEVLCVCIKICTLEILLKR